MEKKYKEIKTNENEDQQKESEKIWVNEINKVIKETINKNDYKKTTKDDSADYE